MDEDGHAGDNGIGGDVAARIEGKHNIKPCFVLFPFAVIVFVDMDEDRDLARYECIRADYCGVDPILLLLFLLLGGHTTHRDTRSDSGRGFGPMTRHSKTTA